MRRISAPLAIGLALAGATSCALPSDADAHRSVDGMGRTIQPIIGGAPSGAEHDAVIVLARFRDGVRLGLCSATLVTPNLVLTARHCVTETDAQAACGMDGSPVIGAALHADHPAKELVVFAPRDGVVPSLTDESVASARGLRLVVDDRAETICNQDVAFVLLDRMLAAPVAKIRLGPPDPRERITAVGWGITETGQLPSTRMERADLALVGQGPMLYPDDARYGVGGAEFLVGESACLGDSGGPAMTSKGVVVGVASRAGNGRARDSANLAATCTGESAHAVYAELGPSAPLLARASAASGFSPLLDPVAGGPTGGLGLVDVADGGREQLRVPARSVPVAGYVNATVADDLAHRPDDEGGCHVAVAGARRQPERNALFDLWLLPLAAFGRALRRRRS